MALWKDPESLGRVHRKLFVGRRWNRSCGETHLRQPMLSRDATATAEDYASRRLPYNTLAKTTRKFWPCYWKVNTPPLRQRLCSASISYFSLYIFLFPYPILFVRN